MKKGWKRFWIVCIVLAGVGFVCCTVGAALGGSVAYVEESVERDLDNRYYFHMGVDGHAAEKHHNRRNAYKNTESTTESTSDTAVFGEYSGIRKMDVELHCVDVMLKEYEGDTVRIEMDGISKELREDIRCWTDGDELEIGLVNQNKWRKINSGVSGLVKIFVPKDSLEEVEMNVGAGYCGIDGLHTKELDIEIGAGEAVLTEVRAQNMTVECGAGTATITADVSGESTIECGIGTVQYQAKGKESDYNYTLECGMGTLQIGNMQFDGMVKEKEFINGETERTLDIECGVGDVTVQFVE